MPQQLPMHFTLMRAIGAYVAAILVGSLAFAAIALVNWLVENGYDPARDQHFFAATFFLPWLAAVSMVLVGMAPILIPMYVACIIAVQKWAIRSRTAFMALGIVFAAAALAAFSTWHCLISMRCSLLLTTVTHLPFEAVIDVVVIGTASGMACRTVLIRE